jgi:hypothetical protein
LLKTVQLLPIATTSRQCIENSQLLVLKRGGMMVFAFAAGACRASGV